MEIDLKKLTLPLVMLGPLLGGAVAAGGSYAATRSQINQLELQVGEHGKKIEGLEGHHADDRVQDAEVRKDLGYLVEAVHRLEDKLGTQR